MVVEDEVALAEVVVVVVKDRMGLIAGACSEKSHFVPLKFIELSVVTSKENTV